MEHTQLGDTGVSISRVGFGCWAIGGHGWGRVDDAESIAAIRRAVDAGINVFDTADVYGFGHSEEILAIALGKLRNEVIIATKFGVKWDCNGRISRDTSPQSAVEALENSLRRLKMDCIPLYQVHWPDGRTPIRATIEMLRQCQQAGKIRWIGCCNFPPALVCDALESGPIVSIQAPYNIFDRGIEGAFSGHCRQLGVSMLVYSPLAHGLLSGKYGPTVRFGTEDSRSRSMYFREPTYERSFRMVTLLKQIAARYGKTPAQVAIRWVLDNPDVTCALVGIKTVAQLEEDAGTDWTLAREDRNLIERMSRAQAQHERLDDY